MKVKLYVCPTEGCGDYYGHNGVDLDKPAHARTEDRHAIAKELGGSIIVSEGGFETAEHPVSRHMRSACPTCRARGISVERELVELDFDPAAFTGHKSAA